MAINSENVNFIEKFSKVIKIDYEIKYFHLHTHFISYL